MAEQKKAEPVKIKGSIITPEHLGVLEAIVNKAPTETGFAGKLIINELKQRIGELTLNN